MKKILLLVVLAAVAVPAALAAGDAQATGPGAACKTELTTLGAKDFASLYASTSSASAMSKCVAKHVAAAAVNRASAAKACQAERAMAVDAFKAANGGQTFGEKYGANTNDRNAYGKCVSAKASAKSAKQEASTLKASKACKTERGTDAASRAAFTAKYGGKAGAAFGTCVSGKSKTTG